MDFAALGIAIFALTFFSMIVFCQNLLIMMLAAEVLVFGLILFYFGITLDFFTLDFQMYIFFLLGLAAAESALGLALILAIFRLIGSIELLEIVNLKG